MESLMLERPREFRLAALQIGFVVLGCENLLPADFRSLAAATSAEVSLLASTRSIPP